MSANDTVFQPLLPNTAHALTLDLMQKRTVMYALYKGFCSRESLPCDVTIDDMNDISVLFKIADVLEGYDSYLSPVYEWKLFFSTSDCDSIVRGIDEVTEYIDAQYLPLISEFRIPFDIARFNDGIVRLSDIWTHPTVAGDKIDDY